MFKKLLIGLGALLLLAVLFLGFTLGPAHLQIRDISPDLPSAVELSSLKDNQAGPAKIGYLTSSTQAVEEQSLGHNTFVVEWANGNILLIDLGMDEQVAIEFGELFETLLDADPAVSNGAVADLLGDDLARVKGVAFTHLHQDHVQGIEPICAARAQNVTALHTSDQMTKHNLQTADQFELLQESTCVDQKEVATASDFAAEFPGIGIYPLGGHTPGSTLFAIPVDGTLWLLSGDISNSKDALLQNAGKGFMYSYLMVPEDVDRLAQLRLWLTDLEQSGAARVIVSHDANALYESGMDRWQGE